MLAAESQVGGLITLIRTVLGTPVSLPAWKRSLDLTIAALAVPLMVPVFLVVAAWIKLTSPGPILFRQKRVGKGGETFVMFKFRTMQESASSRVHQDHLNGLIRSDAPMTKLDAIGDSRVIRGGHFLRAAVIDELPQLINVILGNMSIVGPRPCIMEEYELYDADQKARFDGLPGMTGYWQVNGKNKTTFSEMVELDIYYVKHHSLWMDLKIIISTPLTAIEQVFEHMAKRFSRAR
jgi:lipopolysaccharide/colanic/teichoic acid biosynthesis glycosyltransferase